MGPSRSPSARLVVCLLTLLTPYSPLGLCTAPPVIPFWVTYNEYEYAKGWALETFQGFPRAWWNTTSSSACGQGDTPGLFPGVSCSPVSSSGENYVSRIDLSFSSLPRGSRRLRGQLQNPPFLVGLQFLSTLNVDGNLLSGSVPANLALAPQLTKLVLSNNNLSGPIPDGLCSLNLACLSFANNSFNGTIPLCWKDFPCADFEGNEFQRSPGDCDAAKPFPSCAFNPLNVRAPPPPPVPPSPAPFPTWAVIALVVGGLLTVALVVGCLVWGRLRRERKREEEERRLLHESIESELSSGRLTALRRFSAKELEEATGGFGDDNLVAEGGFSRVYKGTLKTGAIVAVKRIKADGAAGLEELKRAAAFAGEVELISRANHKNLTQCLGFCLEPQKCLALVIAFCPNGTVASRTRGKQGAVLPWATRLRIARGTAEALVYLHSECSPAVIHRDVKAENVLLDQGDNPVLADFGLAKAVQEEHSSALTVSVKGTIGHIAPEYFMDGECTVKTDVYAFGIFVLELISGKSYFDLTANTPAVDEGLHEWLLKLFQAGKERDILDQDMKLAAEEASKQARNMVHSAMLCVGPDPQGRPLMGEVLQGLSLGFEEGGGVQQWADRFASESTTWQGGDLTVAELMTTEGWEGLSTGIFMPPIDPGRAMEYLSSNLGYGAMDSNCQQ